MGLDPIAEGETTEGAGNDADEVGEQSHSWILAGGKGQLSEVTMLRHPNSLLLPTSRLPDLGSEANWGAQDDLALQ